MAQSLLDYVADAPVSPPPPTGGPPVTPGRYSQPTFPAASSTGPVGTAPLTGVHNTPLHIAVWGIGALGLIVWMHANGFRLISVGRFGGR